MMIAFNTIAGTRVTPGPAFGVMPLKSQPPPGTRVRMTGRFLASTGQQKGPEGLSRWIVQAHACGLCAGGKHVATDEPSCPDPENLSDPNTAMYADLSLDERRALRRHIALGNLERVGAPPQAEDYDLPIVRRR